MTSILHAVRIGWRRFAHDRGGNVLMIFGLCLVPLTFATGMGIDYARAMRLQTKLNAAADAAALAATSAKLAAVQQQYGDSYYLYYANQAAQQMFVMQTKPLTANGLVINYSDPTQLTIVPTKGSNGAYTYAVSYSADSTNAFGSILKLATLHIKGSSTATMVLPTYIDIHVALDTSQSMGLAASATDAINLYNVTPSYSAHACTFGCHVVASDDSGATKANDVIAKENGIRLRIDALRDAVSQMIQTASDDQGGKSLYRFGLYRIGYKDSTAFGDSTYGANGTSTQKGVSTMTSLSSNLSSVKSDVQGLTLGANVAGGTGDTNLAGVMGYVSPIIGTSGDGSTQSNSRKFLFLVTDGVADLPNPSGCRSGHCTRPLDPAGCQTLKNNGVTVAVLYTTYLPIYLNPNNTSGGLDGRYTSLVKAFSDPNYTSPNPADNSVDIEQTLRSCANSGWFYKADDAAGISAAINQLFQQATQSARLTK